MSYPYYAKNERMLKVSEIKMSVDKVLALAKTITTIQIKLPLNKGGLHPNNADGKTSENRQTL